MYCSSVNLVKYICYLKERKKERKKDRHLRQWKNEKMRVASGGIRTHDTLYSRQMVYQLSYPGSSDIHMLYMYTCKYLPYSIAMLFFYTGL